MPDLRDQVIQRIHGLAVSANEDPEEAVALAEFGRHPAWKIGERWIEFECGCRARRIRTLKTSAQFDPIVFRGLPEQAVYDKPCQAHEAGVNDYVHFGGFVDFHQWRQARLQLITGEIL